jgi:hypothetical protein
MGPQRANWLEQLLSRYKKTAILKDIKSGTLSQMRWTNLSFGLTPGCSGKLHNPPTEPSRFEIRHRFFAS